MTTVPIEVTNVGTIQIVIASDNEIGFYPSGSQEALQRAEDAFERLQQTIQTTITGFRRDIVNNLSDDVAPDKISVEFGVALDAEVNAVITKFATEANFKVKITWEGLRDR